jgi:hypothetical protein
MQRTGLDAWESIKSARSLAGENPRAAYTHRRSAPGAPADLGERGADFGGRARRADFGRVPAGFGRARTAPFTSVLLAYWSDDCSIIDCEIRRGRELLMRTSRAVTTAMAITLFGIHAAAVAHAGNPCAASGVAATQACKNGATDDYWITVGNCLNLPTLDETKACKKAAKAELVDAKSGCADQLDARKSICAAIGKAPYDPPISQGNFLSPTATAASPNQYFPLVPGKVWVYQGGGETDTVTVTNETKTIDGVVTMVVHDVSVEGGHVTEDTKDYYAQDVAGNVWYFGELSYQLENDEIVGTEGSFQAGVDGAQPGIIMKASPQVGDIYRQEFALGEAEDAGEVLSITGTESVPGGSCNGTCVVTHDFSGLEPDANEQKFYAPGIGSILEIDVENGGTRLELMSVTP